MHKGKTLYGVLIAIWMAFLWIVFFDRNALSDLQPAELSVIGMLFNLFLAFTLPYTVGEQIESIKARRLTITGFCDVVSKEISWIDEILEEISCDPKKLMDKNKNMILLRFKRLWTRIQKLRTLIESDNAEESKILFKAYLKFRSKVTDGFGVDDAKYPQDFFMDSSLASAELQNTLIESKLVS